MKKDIYSTLSIPLQQLVDEIESHAGFEIQVRSKSERDEFVTETGEDVVGSITGFDQAVIEYPYNLSDVTEDDFAHELLHLHRAYVGKIPHLFPKKNIHGSTAAGIDNWLEHVVIYDRQRQLSVEFAGKLNVGQQQFWKAYPWNNSGSGLKFNLISRYMIVKLYGSDETKAVMKETLQSAALPYSVRNAAKSALKKRHEKRSFVRNVLDFCDIPSSLFWLRWHDVKAHKNQWFDI